jgi:hypothetical protein
LYSTNDSTLLYVSVLSQINLVHWQYLTICLCPQPDQSSPMTVPYHMSVLSQINRRPPFSFLKINFCVAIPSVHMSFKWSLSLRLPHRNPACTSPVPHTWHMPCPSHSSLFDHTNNKYLLRSVNYKAPKYLPLHVIAKHPCPPLMWENKFHAHVKQLAKLQFGMF